METFLNEELKNMSILLLFENTQNMGFKIEERF